MQAEIYGTRIICGSSAQSMYATRDLQAVCGLLVKRCQQDQQSHSQGCNNHQEKAEHISDSEMKVVNEQISPHKRQNILFCLLFITQSMETECWFQIVQPSGIVSMTTCFSDSWKTVTSHLCHCGPSAHLNLYISRFTQFTDHIQTQR